MTIEMLTPSSISRTVARDGFLAEVLVYADGEGGWVLEILCSNGGSWCWPESFAAENDALQEALACIYEEQIFLGRIAEGLLAPTEELIP